MFIRFFKTHMKLPCNTIIKKDIKTLMVSARKGNNIETKLWALHKVNNLYGDKFTDADHLFILLTYLHEKHGFTSSLDEPESHREKGILYTSSEEINTCFNDDNLLITPLPLFIIMDEPERLVELINGHGGMFVAELASSSTTEGCATIVLQKVETSPSSSPGK